MIKLKTSGDAGWRADQRHGAIAFQQRGISIQIMRRRDSIKNKVKTNQRMVRSGALYVWDFDEDGGDLNVRVSGQLIFNTSEHIVDAALAGLGIAFLPEEEFGNHIQEGRLIRILEPWCRPFAGYHLYYPSRKQPSPAFSLVVEALRLPVTSDRQRHQAMAIRSPNVSGYGSK